MDYKELCSALYDVIEAHEDDCVKISKIIIIKYINKFENYMEKQEYEEAEQIIYDLDSFIYTLNEKCLKQNLTTLEIVVFSTLLTAFKKEVEYD